MASKVLFTRIKGYVNGQSTNLLRLAFWLWCAYEVMLGLYVVMLGLTNRMDWLTYNTFEVSDWMINYQGGFVRRGIVGEALYQLYLFHPYPLRTAIFGIMAVAFLTLLFLLLRLFRRNGWSYILFPSCVLIVQSFTNWGFWVRKDHILLLGTFLVFLLYRKWISRRARLASYIAMQVVAMLLMLIHEATMFFTIPILTCDLFGRLYRTNKQGVFVSAAKSVLFFSPVFVTWIAVCLCKGSDDVAAAIWNSWKPAMQAYPIGEGSSTDEIGLSVAWLGMSFTDAALFHLEGNFMGRFIPQTQIPIPSFPFTLYCYVAIYYVVTRMQTVDLKLNRLKGIDTVLLSNILLAQFLFLLPMFTVLSCDRGRTIPYWIVSSLFLYHFLADKNLLFPRKLTLLSEKAQAWIASKRLLNNPFVYFCIIVTIPLAQYGNTSISLFYHYKYITYSSFGFRF